MARTTQPRDEHGYRQGSNSSIAVNEMLKGGSTRQEVADRIAEACGGTTRNGTPINGSGMMTTLIKELADKGYTVETTWTLVPPRRRIRKKPPATA